MSSDLTFIDLCSGIGGGRLGLEQQGASCVAFSEIDSKAIKTYSLFYGDSDIALGDLTKVDESIIPDVDLLIAGFPCQTFSIVGKRAGFDDIRGQIIFKIVNILKKKNIKYFILENVKGLKSVDKGNVLSSIVNLLDRAGYNVSWQIINSLNHGVPQKRERIYFVGIRKDLNLGDYIFPQASCDIHYNLSDYLIDDSKEFILDANSKKYSTFLKYLNNKYNEGKYNLNSLLKEELLILDTRQSDLRLYRNEVPTLRTGRHGILYVRNKQLRYLSGKEALLLQGFPISFLDKVKGVSNTALLSQAGNAMTVNVIFDIAKELIRLMDNVGIKKYG